MFCKKCGAQIADDAAFCQKCGAQIADEEIKQTVSDASAEDDEWQLNTRSGALNVFLSVQKAYNELMPLIDEKTKLEKEREYRSKPKPTDTAVYLTLSLFAIAAGIAFILPAASSGYRIVWLSIAVVLFIAGAILFFVAMNESEKKNMDDPLLPEVEQKLSQTESRIKQITQKHPELAIFPQECFDEYAISKGISYLQNRQADSYKEVLSMCQEDMHRQRMEELQNEMLSAQNRIAAETARARKAATATAVFTGITAFNTRKKR